MSDVFISHVEEDTEIALEIALGLEEAGYTTWCYELDNIPGPSYLIQTGQAVEQARALVLIISPHSLGSRQITKEVVRAHESGADFLPILRGITHIEFQNRQPEWREAIGAAASIGIPPEGVAGILPRITSGLKILEILPRSKPDTARIEQIRKTLNELSRRGAPEQVAAPPIPTRKTEAEAIVAEVPPKIAKEAVGRKKLAKPALIASGLVASAAVIAIVVGIVFSHAGPPSPLPTTSATPSSPTPEVPPPTTSASTPAPVDVTTSTPSPTPVVVEGTVTLTYETFLPNTDRFAMADTWFFNKVARLSGGRIKMEYRYGVSHNAISSPLLGAVGEGDVDCGIVPLFEIPHLVPLSQGLILNYLTYYPDTMALSAKSLYKTFTPLSEEWEVTNNVKVLYFLPLDTNVLCTTSPVSGVADLEGHKICSYSWAADSLERFGAEPVYMPATRIYEAIEQGEIYGALRSFDGISSFNFFEAAEYLTEPWAGPAGMFATVINKDVWDGLLPYVKDLMESLSEDALTHYLETDMEENRQAVQEMVTAGVNFYVWPESEREKAQNQVQPAQAQDWIEEVGTSGQELINRLKEELAVFEPQSTYKSGFEIWQEEYGEPGPRLLFQDDFSDPNSGWYIASVEKYEINYKDGEYYITTNERDWACWGTNSRAGAFIDFALEVDARLVSGSNQSYYGVIFRFRDNNNFYRFEISADGNYRIGTRIAGQWTERLTKASPYIKKGNSTNQLKVICRGNQIEVSVNEQYLTTVTDNTFTVGLLGFISHVYSITQDNVVAFDNIKVYSLD